MLSKNEKKNHYLLKEWKPENAAFWENKGKQIARRNLCISVGCLLLAFCVWMLFSAVAVNLNKVGFNFTTDQLFLLTACLRSLAQYYACPTPLWYLYLAGATGRY